MTRSTLRQDQVKAHYRELALEYGRRANRTCEETYRRLVHRHLKVGRILELGSGSSELLESLESPMAVACDLSEEMLRSRPGGSRTHRVVAACERLPFGDDQFDGLFLINVLEHIADLERVLSESARVLRAGGLWLAITPNGNWEIWLDLAERWSLKIPEGPHEFLTTRRLAQAILRDFELVEHRTMLMLPAGPPSFSALIDRLTVCSVWGWGFFQCLVARKRRKY